MDNTLAWYIEDTREYIGALNEALIKIENDRENDELVHTIFRVAHSIKGNSAAVKMFKIKEVVHAMEDILQDVREGVLEISEELIKALYRCHDFLEDSIKIIARDKTDDNIKTESILELLECIGNNNDFYITPDIIELIEENIKRGFELYHIKVDISKQSTMRGIINSNIIKTMRMHGHVIGTLPKYLNDTHPVNTKLTFRNTHSEFLVLSEDEQSNMLVLLKDEPEVKRYECNKLTQQQRRLLFQKSSNKSIVKAALRHIDEIKIEALDIKNEFVNNEAVAKIRYNFDQISAIIDQSNSYYAKMIITKTCEVLNKMEANKICFDAIDMQNFVFICNKLSELVQDPSLEVNREFVDEIEDRILYLAERCSKQRRRIGDILVEEGIISNEDVQDILEMQKKRISQFEIRSGSGIRQKSFGRRYC